MKNEDRLLQIISNVQQLNDLATNMIEADMYPVSFFSRAFDLIQKLQSDFHTLEAKQVEIFANQLKEHQRLILSMHQDIRQLTTKTQRIITKVTGTDELENDFNQTAADQTMQDVPQAMQPATDQTMQDVQQAMQPESQAEQRDTSFRQEPDYVENIKDSPVIIPPDDLRDSSDMTDEPVEVSTKVDAPVQPATFDAPVEIPPKPVPPVVQEAIPPKPVPPVVQEAIPPKPVPPAAPEARPAPPEAPTARPARPIPPTATEARPAQPNAPAARPVQPAAPEARPARPAPPEAPVTRPARPAPPEVPVARPARPVPPEAPVTRPARPVPPNAPAAARPVSPEVREPQAEASGIPSFLSSIGAGAPADQNEKHPPEPNVQTTLNDVIKKGKLSDFREAFSLNDHFRYRRELFGGSEETMNKVIAILNNKQSLDESLLFIEQKLRWDLNDPNVQDFVKKLEIRFL